MKILLTTLSIFLFSLFASGKEWRSEISVRNDLAIFTFHAWITIAKYDSVDHEKMLPLKEFVWKHLDRHLPSEYKQQIRQLFRSVDNRMLEYDITMLALNCTAPPELVFKREGVAGDFAGWEMDTAVYMKPFNRLLPLLPAIREFYEKAEIEELYVICSPWYDDACRVLKKKVSNGISRALKYMSISDSAYSAHCSSMVIIPNLIGPRGSAMGPMWQGVKYDVHTPWDELDYSPHEFIHDMVMDLTRNGKYGKEIAGITGMLSDSVKSSTAFQYYPDPVRYFDECLVRTLDHLVKEGWQRPWMREKAVYMLQEQAGRGFVLCPVMASLLVEYEKSGVSFSDYFPVFLDKMSHGSSLMSF